MLLRKYRLKYFVVVTIFLALGNGYAQSEIKNIDKIYQSILDNDRFVKLIQSDRTYLCNGTLYFQQTGSDSIPATKLTFQGKPLLLSDTTGCPYLMFEFRDLVKGQYKLMATVHKTTGHSGSCVFYKTKYYVCTLIKSGDEYKIENESVGSGKGQAKF